MGKGKEKSHLVAEDDDLLAGGGEFIEKGDLPVVERRVLRVAVVDDDRGSVRIALRADAALESRVEDCEVRCTVSVPMLQVEKCLQPGLSLSICLSATAASENAKRATRGEENMMKEGKGCM
jgi:hypothetical protein